MPDLATTTRVLRHRSDTYTATFTDDESGDVVDPGVVTIEIANALGVELQAVVEMSGSGATSRTFSLTPTHTAALDRLAVTLVSETFGTFDATLDVVARHLFSIPQARMYHDGALADHTKYPSERIATMRDRISDEFEIITGVSFVERYDLVTGSSIVLDSSRLLLYKSNGDPALLVTSIRSVDTRSSGSADWTALTSEQLAGIYLTNYGAAYRESLGLWSTGVDNTRVGFEHGFRSTPLPIVDAALKLVRYLLVPSNVNSRALQEVGEFGTVQLATAGRYGDHYGIPDVDSVLDRYSHLVAVVR